MQAGIRVFVSGAEDEEPWADVVVPLSFQGARSIVILRIGMIAAGAAVPAMAAVANAGKDLSWPYVALMLIGGVVSAVATVFPTFKR